MLRFAVLGNIRVMTTNRTDAVRIALLLAGSLLPLAMANSAQGQFLYGRPVAQPCFDFPTWARFSNCRPGPMAWGYEVFPDYGPRDCACNDCGVPPSVACPGDFVAHRPTDWYATADLAPLTIDYGDGFVVARIPEGPVVLTTNDLRPEFDSGGKFTIGRRIFDCYRIEGTYLGAYDWEDQRLVTNDELNEDDGVGNLSTFLSGFADPPIPGLDGNNLVSIAMQSSMQSAEINVRYWANMPPGPFDVSYLVGARYFRIRDQFNFFGQADVDGDPPFDDTTNDVQFNTANDMWGVQLGIAGAFLKTTRFWCDFDLKGGIYSNEASQTTSYLLDGVEQGPFSVTRNRTSWVGDLSIVGNWQMTPRIVLRAGYQAIFMNGVVMGQDQVQSPLVNNIPGPIDDAGNVAYHGPILGLTWIR
jgi:hypothetical protein